MSFAKQPSPPLGNTPEAVWHRQLLRYIESLLLHDVIGGKKINHAAGGFSIQVDPAKSGGAGWDWADPREYNPSKAYGVRNVVIVSPTNTANTDGINNGIALATGGAIVGMDGFGANLDKATAGWWECIKSPKVLHETQPSDPDDPRNYRVHVPVWPLPDEDKDSANNYWMLIGLYPVTLGVCINGVNKSYYVQAQPVPEEILLDEGGAPMSGEGGEEVTGE